MKYLTRKANSNNYYVRVPIPLELQPFHGKKKEIWRSLGTPDRREAQSRAYRMVADVRDELAGKQNEAVIEPALVVPNQDQMEKAAIRYYEMLVEADLEERSCDPVMFREFWEPKGNKKVLKMFQGKFAVGDYTEVAVDDWAHEYGFDLKPETPREREFAQLLMRATLEATRRAIEHDQGKVGGKPEDTLFRAKGRRSPQSSALGTTAPTEAKSEPSLLELFEKHKQHQASRLKSDTLEQRRKPIRRFVEFVGESTAPSQITKAQARDWRDALRQWPLKADQRKEFAGLDFGQVIRKNETLGIKVISERSIAKYVSEVSSLLTWMVKDGYVEANVFDNLHLRPGKGQPVERTFTDEQLVRLFASPLFTGCAGPDGHQPTRPGTYMIRDWRFWLPVLAAFTGARQSELAQLEIADVAESEGIPYLRITNSGEDRGKSVKNKFSVRNLPLNPMVVDLGFLQYVDSVRKKGGAQVFPETNRDKRGAFADVSKFYQKYFKAISLRDHRGQNAVFHSFRHRFTDELRRNYPPEWFKPLLGHSGRDITSGYGESEALSLERRYDMIKTIEYPMVDWSAVGPYGTTSSASHKFERK